jgi:hypothetical protein
MLRTGPLRSLDRAVGATVVNQEYAFGTLGEGVRHSRLDYIGFHPGPDDREE